MFDYVLEQGKWKSDRCTDDTVVVMGDSAGGMLTMQVLERLHLRSKNTTHESMPSCSVLISPAIDSEMSAMEKVDAKEARKTDYLDDRYIARCSNFWFQEPLPGVDGNMSKCL